MYKQRVAKQIQNIAKYIIKNNSKLLKQSAKNKALYVVSQGRS